MTRKYVRSKVRSKPRPTMVDPTAKQKASSRQALKDDLDALLAEVDEVLEENAEDFVKGYIQKGGE
jgi:ubiquitin-like protein Pup